MSYVSAYTLMIGDAGEAPVISVHGRAEDAWRALDRELRARTRTPRLWWRPVDPDEVGRRADAWRDGDREHRFWQIRAHQLSVTVPVTVRPRTGAPL
ncbi:hypothetical protein [Pseudonocardia nigra]|uniref:hypothetical protein n=1 Tax=Pseudonocardia nigra TaxID=1921578 RepID=UPI001C5ECA0F|nr:hypothetical protein [Pseudonocardia nigra]